MEKKIYTSNSGLEFTILSKNGKQCIIQFLLSGSTRSANFDNITKGKVKDLYSPSRYGVGYHGEFDRVSYWKPVFQLWSNMLKRCYCENDLKGYFHKGVTVDPRWHCFANFLEDVPKLKNFDKWLGHFNKGTEKYNLDKEFVEKNCNVYSKYTCGFETEYKNKQAGKLGKSLVDGEWVTTTL
jgi:hypothetical protein